MSRETCHRIQIVFGDDENVATWVKMRIPVWVSPGSFTTIGIADETGPLAGVLYNGFRKGDCNIHIASDSPRWCTRKVLRVCFGYPFVQLGQRRLTAVAMRKNQNGRRFIERVGFRVEGKIRRGFPKDDGILYGMLREECRWIDE